MKAERIGLRQGKTPDLPSTRTRNCEGERRERAQASMKPPNATGVADSVRVDSKIYKSQLGSPNTTGVAWEYCSIGKETKSHNWSSPMPRVWPDGVVI